MVFRFLTKAALGVTADLIAKKASSPEAFSGGASTAFSTHEPVQRFFQKYGTTERKFEFHAKQGFYTGYVKMPGQEEFLSVILMQTDGSVVASFYPERRYGQDLLSLIAKKSFADQVTAQFISTARLDDSQKIGEDWTYITTIFTHMVGDYPDSFSFNDYTGKEAAFERVWNQLMNDHGYRMLSVDDGPTDHIKSAFESWGAPLIRWRSREGRMPAKQTQGLFEDDWCFEHAELHAKGLL